MAQKYNTGDKVKFLFLGAPHVGTILEFNKVDVHGSVRPRYIVSDGKYKYPIPFEHLLGKICETK